MTQTIPGFYGHLTPNPCDIFVYENRDGSRWYVVDGGSMVNKTFYEIVPGTNVEDLQDVDCFTWHTRIEDMDEFIAAVEA